MRTLVLGGARSGKSCFAEELVGDASCVYVATARPYSGEFDADFAERIRHHVQRRPARWVTEDARDVTEVLSSLRGRTEPLTVLVDDLGTWVTHLIDRRGGWAGPRGQLAGAFDALLEAIAALPSCVDLIVVSPEVGMGIIPEHHAGRLFRDEIGTLNQQVAGVCERVELVVAGQALPLKR